MNGVSIIIPLCNGAETIGRTLDSLERQIWDGKMEVLLVDDHSLDSSVAIVLSHPLAKTCQPLPACSLRRAGRPPPARPTCRQGAGGRAGGRLEGCLRVIPNTHGGTAGGCNLGFAEARYEYLIIMHQDCYVPDPAAIHDLVAPFSDPSVVGVMSLNELPKDDWGKMSFWDKVANARYVGKREHGFGGKFDGLRRSAVLQVGGFDAQTFFSAGDDCDLLIRLRAIGKVVPSSVSVVHAHLYPPRTQLVSLFRKQFQLGQGFGAVLRKSFPRLPGFSFLPAPSLREWGQAGWKIFVIHIFKMGLCLLLFVPRYTVMAFLVLCLMGIAYSWRALFVRDWRALLVPFVFVIQFLVFSFGFLTGIVRGRQCFDYTIRNVCKHETRK